MGIHTIKMPDIGEGIVEVEVVAWRIKVGDSITEDQILADVMTDKATVEIPSPVHGRVLALGGEAGEVMRVGSDLVRIEVDGAGAEAAPESAPPPVATAAPAPIAAKTMAQAPAAVASPPPAAVHRPQDLSPSDKPIASPSVRRRAWELGIDLAQVRPSGSGGRIMHADLEGVSAQPKSPTAYAAAQAPAPRKALAADEVIKITGLRRKIAQKMQESKRRIPHFSYVEEVDVTELEALREQLNQRWGATRGKLTVLPLLVRAITRAVVEFPQVNARLDDEAGVLTRYAAVHLGVAAQTDAGLMVPVLRDAQNHDLWSSAVEIKRLADVARSGRATRDELTGSTLTLTSLGALGGIVTTPVVNHPEVAIVGVNKIVERPMMRGGLVVGRLMMNLSSSFDHRVVDGMIAAQFIQAIRAQLESPAMLFVD
ncbi:dihydrolipoamide acetyltransferase family protein [Roseateles oligotrophus]|uniref:Dihydrolipoamide acetyltransferase component of pyruvate dehydrogenase complex n=1 Tax=Roseateles oligotrophus TaxID=1769250 RepID=A0ABT2YG81_9BURK|nr:dihydrolipoamide acetyltransferase family protein [Roseateles oligotrophus]MCV2369063.1 2-oxo acid dehydrogenase subunit E2 [Roseateles oligotrophus]